MTNLKSSGQVGEPANGVVIETPGLIKRFKKVTAVDGLDLGVCKGEIFGLLGPARRRRSTCCARSWTPLKATPTWQVSIPGRSRKRSKWDILTELHIDGVTLFVSMPYMDEAERCSRVSLMFDGSIIVCDTLERIKGLVAGQLLELRPDELRKATQLTADLPGVLKVQTYGDLLHVFVDDAAQRAPELEAALARAGIAAEGFRQTRPRTEEAFISLIRKQSEEG